MARSTSKKVGIEAAKASGAAIAGGAVGYGAVAATGMTAAGMTGAGAGSGQVQDRLALPWELSLGLRRTVCGGFFAINKHQAITTDS